MPTLIKQEFADEFHRRNKQYTRAQLQPVADLMRREDHREIEKRCKAIVDRVMNPDNPCLGELILRDMRDRSVTLDGETFGRIPKQEN